MRTYPSDELAVLSYLKTTLEKINKHLDQLILEKNVPYNSLFQAARYALIGEAKRIRPLLTLATAAMLGISEEVALTPACALEIIHTYSLIHDDLPCMDNDDFRRGKPTVHRIYNEGHAVLTGDFLLTYAFEVIVEAPLLSDKQKLSLISYLAKNAGAHGMIGGQIMDIAATEQSLDLSTLELLHRCKTGALLSTAIEFALIIADKNVEERHKATLRQFAQSIGLAFQIVDDILDVTHSETKHGKAISSDVVNGKTTYVNLLGLQEAQRKVQMLYTEASEALKALPYNTAVLEKITSIIILKFG